MHQTTVRFSPELWEMLEAEAELTGVSVAHYVRESALSRLAFAAGRRSTGVTQDADRFAWADPRIGKAVQAQLGGRDQVSMSSAVRAQAELAGRRAAQLREDAAAVRRARD